MVEMEEKDTPQQFADKVQQQLAVSLGARCCSANRTDYNKWLNGAVSQLLLHSTLVSFLFVLNTDPPCPSPPKLNPPTTSAVVGPYIPEAEFPHIPENMDSMVEQVTSVLPQVPHTVVRSQLSEYNPLPCVCFFFSTDLSSPPSLPPFLPISLSADKKC